MNQQEHSMTVFAEECGEIAVELLALQKNLLKALRFGIDEQRDLPTSNRDRIESEWQDLLGSMEHLRSRGIDITPDPRAIAEKLGKINRYCEYAEELGTLTPDEPDHAYLRGIRREVSILQANKPGDRSVERSCRAIRALLDREQRGDDR